MEVRGQFTGHYLSATALYCNYTSALEHRGFWLLDMNAQYLCMPRFSVWVHHQGMEVGLLMMVIAELPLHRRHGPVRARS